MRFGGAKSMKSKQSEENQSNPKNARSRRLRYFTSTTIDRFSSMSGRMFDD
jgi:hypothetical protein